MWLRATAGAYAGQIREYGTATGLAALRTGTAERVIESAPVVVMPQSPVTAQSTAPDKRRKVAGRQTKRTE
jgi:hypothetical protein